MSRMAEKALLERVNYKLFRFTTEWQKFQIADYPYVCYSHLTGLTPCMDVRDTAGRLSTMLINQMSLGRQLNALFNEGYSSSDAGEGYGSVVYVPWFEVRKVDLGKFAAIEMRKAEDQSGGEEEEDGLL